MKTKNEKKIDIISITKTAVVIALVALLGMTPLGYLNIGALQITTVHALVIIIAIVFGLKEGWVAGITFGITSIITALTNSGLFAPIFLNPIVSVLPRVLLPFVAYWLFRFFYVILSRRMNNRTALSIAAGISAVLSTLFHSVLVITLIWAFRWMSPGLTDETLLPIIIGLLTVNMSFEILFALIAVALITPILYPWFNKEDYAAHEREPQAEVAAKDDVQEHKDKADEAKKADKLAKPAKAATNKKAVTNGKQKQTTETKKATKAKSVKKTEKTKKKSESASTKQAKNSKKK
jgi:uncharacterized membrane protein